MLEGTDLLDSLIPTLLQLFDSRFHLGTVLLQLRDLALLVRAQFTRLSKLSFKSRVS